MRACVGIFLIAAVLAPGVARAQTAGPPTRTDLLEAARQKKRAETAPPKRGLVERTLYWYDNQYVFAKILGGWHGFHLAGGDFPAGAGTKIGVGFSPGFGSTGNPARPHYVNLDTVAAYSTSGYLRTRAAVNIRPFGAAPFDLRLQGERYEFPQEDFFGLGQDSAEENRTNYLLESVEYGGTLRWQPARFVDLGAGVFHIDPEIRSGTDSRFPTTEALFDPSSAPGLTAQPTFLRGDASAALDWRDNPRHPHSGGRYGVSFSDYRDQDLDLYSFRRVTIDLQQYVPLPNRYRTVALRAAAVLTDPRAGNDVPFFYQPTVGGSQALRGFREFRFRGRNSLLLTAEYRWEASWLLDGALFVDAGKVTGDRDEINFRDLDVSYGVGFRVHSNDAFIARLDLAFSREGFIPLLRFEHVF